VRQHSSASFAQSPEIEYEQLIHELDDRYGAGEWLGEESLAEAVDSYISTLDPSPAQRTRERPHMRP
jgi:hypothetical protein